MQIIRKNVPRNASLFCLLMFSLFHQTKPGLDCSEFDILSSVVSKFSPVPKSDPYRPIQRSWNFDDQLLKEVVAFTKLMYRIGVRIRFSNSPKKGHCNGNCNGHAIKLLDWTRLGWNGQAELRNSRAKVINFGTQTWEIMTISPSILYNHQISI